MTLPEDRGYFNSPSVYRGKPASKREQWGKLASELPSKSWFETGFRAQYGETGREFEK